MKDLETVKAYASKFLQGRTCGAFNYLTGQPITCVCMVHRITFGDHSFSNAPTIVTCLVAETRGTCIACLKTNDHLILKYFIQMEIVPQGPIAPCKITRSSLSEFCLPHPAKQRKVDQSCKHYSVKIHLLARRSVICFQPHALCVGAVAQWSLAQEW